MLVFRKKGRKITMYENMKILSCFDGYYTGDEPFGIRFVGETLCDDEFIIERPCSDLASFEYIVDGCGTLEINGQVLHPKKGDIFFLSENSSHKYYSQKENGWHKYFISFYGPVAKQLIKYYLPENTYLFENCYLEKAFSHIFDIAFNSTDIQSAQEKLSVEVFKIFSFLRNRNMLENKDPADKIKAYIENHLSDEFNLERLCCEMNYSKNHVINLFSKKFSVTPYQYYIHCKISLAKEYLTNTNMTILEISNALAYSDQQYFSYCFKKASGVSPRKYRNHTKM